MQALEIDTSAGILEMHNGRGYVYVNPTDGTLTWSCEVMTQEELDEHWAYCEEQALWHDNVDDEEYYDRDPPYTIDAGPRFNFNPYTT